MRQDLGSSGSRENGYTQWGVCDFSLHLVPCDGNGGVPFRCPSFHGSSVSLQ